MQLKYLFPFLTYKTSIWKNNCVKNITVALLHDQLEYIRKVLSIKILLENDHRDGTYSQKEHTTGFCPNGCIMEQHYKLN
jgi:hypothetical protein